jgi:hypothetical protein
MDPRKRLELGAVGFAALGVGLAPLALALFAFLALAMSESTGRTDHTGLTCLTVAAIAGVLASFSAALVLSGQRRRLAKN